MKTANIFEYDVSVGDHIECDYHGKHRVGEIVEIQSRTIRVKTQDGFRCFTVKEITNFKVLCEI